MAQRLPPDYAKAAAFVVLDINVIGVRSCGADPNKRSCIQQLR
jgi:hypothetical protein